MALNIIDTKYAGTFSDYIINLAMFGMDSVENGIVYVQGGIKKQHTITRLDIKNPLSVNQETPTDDGSNPWNLDGRVLVPQDIQCFKNYNPRDFETDQYSEMLEAAILMEMAPEAVESKMLMVLMGRAAEQVELGIWQGSTAFQNAFTDTNPLYQLQFFNGFIQQFVNDASVVLSTISPVTITVSNIQAIMDNLKYLVSTTDHGSMITKKNRKKLCYIMSIATYDLFTLMLINLTFKGLMTTEDDVIFYRGIKVKAIAGVPDNTVVLCFATDDPESGLYVGMNSEEDWNFQIKEMPFPAESWGMLAKWKYGVQYGWSQQIFMYTTLTAANFLP